MRAIKLSASGDQVELDIDLTYDVVQRHVGGRVAQVPLFDDPATVLLINEDGGPRRPGNPAATRLARHRRPGDRIVGDAVVVGVTADGRWTDCPAFDLDGTPWPVAVYHNTNREAMLPFRGHRPGDPLTLVARYHTIAASVDAALNRAWFLFNVGEDPSFGTPAPVAVAYRQRRNRSLSIGDVLVVTEGNGFAITAEGHKPVEMLTVTNAEVHGTTPLDGAS